MEGKKKRRTKEVFAWDELPDSWKELFTPEEWEESMREALAQEARDRLNNKRPSDWVEPTMTIEQAEADPYERIVLEIMRRHGLKVISRSQYFDLAYPDGVPRPWTAELELDVPRPLQDKYLTVPGRGKWSSPKPRA